MHDQQIGLRKCKHITWKPKRRVWFRKNDDGAAAQTAQGYSTYNVAGIGH